MVEALFSSGELGLHLLEGHAGAVSVFLRFAPLILEPFKQRREFSHFSCEHLHPELFIAQCAFKGLYGAADIAQLTLQRQGALSALLAACDGDVVEGFTGRREEECVRVFKGQFASDGRIGRDIAVSQLGQDDFERFSKAVQDPNTARERYDGITCRGTLCALIDRKRKLCLRIIGVDQEGGSAVGVALE